MVSRHRDGTFSLHLDEEERALLATLVDQLDPLLDDPSADRGLRRLFPPAHPDDLLREAEWQIQQGGDLRDAHRAALEVVRTAGPDRLTEDEVMTWVQGINALRLVLAERIGVEADEEAETAALDAAIAVVGDPDRTDEERDRARRLLAMWQVYELLGELIGDAVAALD